MSTRARNRDGGITVRRGAIGVLTRGGYHLLIRRAPGVLAGGAWCYPGGHLEPGEYSRQAIEREFAEELGLKVEARTRLGALRIRREYILAVWRVHLCGGEMCPAPAEVAEVRWVPPEQVTALTPGLASNAEVLTLLEKIPGN